MKYLQKHAYSADADQHFWAKRKVLTAWPLPHSVITMRWVFDTPKLDSTKDKQTNRVTLNHVERLDFNIETEQTLCACLKSRDLIGDRDSMQHYE